MCLPEGERDTQTSMALEAVVYPQDYPFGKDLYPHWPYHDDFDLAKQEDHQGFLNFLDNQTENYGFGDWTNICSSPPSMLPAHLNELHLPNHPSSDTSNNPTPSSEPHPVEYSSNSRPKRRRARTRKNKEEIENQRMTHIAVERNRRKQMNEYLSVLRSLMPDSYVQRGDQASIIGGAINFVKELEQSLQFLGGQNDKSEKKPFSEFFTFPQYSTSSNGCGESSGGEKVGEESCIADIEVTMVESHANLKIRSRKRPKQLLKIVSALHSMRLTILHLNVTTSADIVLYCISVKLEEECKLGSVEEIASAVNQTLERIQQDSMQNQHSNLN